MITCVVRKYFRTIMIPHTLSYMEGLSICNAGLYNLNTRTDKRRSGLVNNISALMQCKLYSFFGQCDLRTQLIFPEENITIEVETSKTPVNLHFYKLLLYHFKKYTKRRILDGGRREKQYYAVLRFSFLHYNRGQTICKKNWMGFHSPWLKFKLGIFYGQKNNELTASLMSCGLKSSIFIDLLLCKNKKSTYCIVLLLPSASI